MHEALAQASNTTSIRRQAIEDGIRVLVTGALSFHVPVRAKAAHRIDHPPLSKGLVMPARSLAPSPPREGEPWAPRDRIHTARLRSGHSSTIGIVLTTTAPSIRSVTVARSPAKSGPKSTCTSFEQTTLNC